MDAYGIYRMLKIYGSKIRDDKTIDINRRKCYKLTKLHAKIKNGGN